MYEMLGKWVTHGTRLVWVLLALQIPGGPVSLISGKPDLGPYITDYEILDYATGPVARSHSRHKRSVSHTHRVEENPVELSFTAHGREFNLNLIADHSMFHPGYHATGPLDSPIVGVDNTNYEGYVVGEPDSHVFGSVRDGVFDGTIRTQRDGTFYVERSQKYLPVELVNSTTHSVIYHHNHLTMPFDKSWQIGAASPGCGANKEIQTWMSDLQMSNVDAPAPPSEPKPSPLVSDPAPSLSDPRFDPNPEYKYTHEANRFKRAIKPPNNRKSCSLFIQTDPLLWRHVKEQELTDSKTQEEILSMIAQHVKAVNRIYGDTEFAAGKYRHTGHTFQVNRIKILNDSDCNVKPKNPFCLSNIDVSNFLNLHSKTDHEHFCLAYVLTYRDFTGGTLGLAWVASASGASGGICEKYKTYTENVNGIHHTAQRSLNTGIITFVNYNARVPPKVSQLTLAHEIGHNFGSPHDYPPECRPGGGSGNYIMFASATSGDRDNNNKFSPCSVQNISAVLDAVVDERKHNCFKESNGAFCGNKIVEEGEECDCGFDEAECAEQCCYPRTFGTSGESSKLNSQSCKLKGSAQCSPSIGPCCDQSCNFIKERHRQLCKAEQDCTRKAYCNGSSALCPKADNMPDNTTECNEGTKVCQQGDCKGSICLKYGLEQCFLSSDDKVHHSTRDLCELACREPGRNGTCKSTGDWVESGERANRGLIERLSLRPGAPCDNFQGYCDVFLKCRQVDAEGPLVRLKNLLFNQRTLLTIAQWVTTYWYAVLLMGIGFVITMALFIKCFAAHTPSSNPKLPKNKHIGETLRRPMHTLRRKRYQQAPGSAPGSSSSSAPPSRGAPPPYPGAPSGGPGHGYGEGRGHYNRSRGSGDPRGGGQPQGGDRRSWAPQQGQQRSSRIEMSPISR
eukprot:TRINITY_DN13825_c0_g1_i1.p1 TRINITY_DN13825_c0_g1~~TRINITY_DN13825_c0_g1_i1.p1  ORF type:complete len:904 (+),score=186.49 TRINITY_DN13825_c0_g1_i1:90-2801(+)